MTRDELNPSQRGVSVERLDERLSSLDSINRAKFDAVHHHVNTVDTKVDQIEAHVATVELVTREHLQALHHEGTRDKLLELSKTQLDFERAIGQVRQDIAAIREARAIEKAAADASDATLKNVRDHVSTGLTFFDKLIALILAGAMFAIGLLK